jgi:hypothetical protein
MNNVVTRLSVFGPVMNAAYDATGQDEGMMTASAVYWDVRREVDGVVNSSVRWGMAMEESP